MTEKMELVLAEALTKALDVAEKTGDFVVEQSPEVVQQLLVWKFTTSVLSCFFLVLVTVSLSLVLRYLKKNTSDFTCIEVGLCTAIYIILLSIIAPVLNLFTWLKILIAPKLYLLEYAANLVK